MVIRGRDRGVTLVELMITLIVAGIVASGTFVFFVGQRRIYDTQMKVLNAQQNLWASMETMSRFVRLGGMGMIGCVSPTAPPPTGTTPPATGARAYRAGPPEAVVRLAPIWIRNGANGAADEITVVFGTGSFGNFTDADLAISVTDATDAIKLPTGLTSIFRPGEFILLLDKTASPAGPPVGDRGCTLFQVTGIDAGGDLLLHAGTSAWNPTANVAGMIPFNYVGGAAATAGVRNFGTLNWVRFAIATTASGTPQLTMTRLDGLTGSTEPQVLADGIEDLQIAYACDVGGAGPDGVYTEGTDAASKKNDEWIYNTAGDLPPPQCNRPQAIRLTIIARSTEPDSSLAGVPGNIKPAVEDGVAGTRDTFRHRAMTTTIYPRNR